MKIWIDRNSGTWGLLESNLVILDAEEAGDEIAPGDGVDAALDVLNGGSDSEIIAIADRALDNGYGRIVK